MSSKNPLHPSIFPLPRRKWTNEKPKVCMACKKKFSGSIFRSGRHHCRKCGNTVCTKCFQRKLRQHRVCNPCFKLYAKYQSMEDVIPTAIISSNNNLHTNISKHSSHAKNIQSCEEEEYSYYSSDDESYTGESETIISVSGEEEESGTLLMADFTQTSHSSKFSFIHITYATIYPYIYIDFLINHQMLMSHWSLEMKNILLSHHQMQKHL